MSERTRNILTVGLASVMAVALVLLVATNPSEADRVQSIGERIMCPVCQGESIANSPSTMARDMMDLVSERVAQGHADREIIEELLASFSGAVLLDPPVGGATLALWAAPLVAMLVGMGVILWWRRHPAAAQGDDDSGRDLRGGRVVPLLILGAAFAGVIVVAGFFIQDRGGPTSGVAALDDQDLADVSNETLEAVIAANADQPELDGMRIALAERYYESGDYRSAFPLYFAVVQSADASDTQVVVALVRLGWMAWDGNADVDASIELFDQALEIDERSTIARYLKGRVLWCGADDPGSAAQLFQQVLSDPELADDSRNVVQSDLDAVNAGATCP